jgi:hypothetical protein
LTLRRKSKKQVLIFWGLFNSLCDCCLLSDFYVNIRPTLIPHGRVAKSDILTRIMKTATPNKWHQRNYLRKISLTFEHDARGVLHNKKNSQAKTLPGDS